jgi:hypothetical protein
MNESVRRTLPWILLAVIALALALAGPIHLPPGYHHFADTRTLFGVPNAVDVLSNVAFVFAGFFGVAAAARLPATPARIWWRVFALAVLAVSVGSAWYHLAPDDARLVWDRLPIALVCAAALAAVLAERFDFNASGARAVGALLAFAAVASVWVIPLLGGDLRPYLLLQLAVLVVIPVLNWARRAPRAEQLAFASASLCYVFAKLVEVADVRVFEASGGTISGHSLKHLLSALACGAVVYVLRRRVPAPAKSVSVLRIAKISLLVLGCGALAVILHEGHLR